jgi:hypothetical protein
MIGNRCWNDNGRNNDLGNCEGKRVDISLNKWNLDGVK